MAFLHTALDYNSNREYVFDINLIAHALDKKLEHAVQFNKPGNDGAVKERLVLQAQDFASMWNILSIRNSAA